MRVTVFVGLRCIFAMLTVLIGGFALNLQPQLPADKAGFTPIPAAFSGAARAQRVCFASDCRCFDEPYRTRCYAEQKAGFERAYPPRGQIEGVCIASLSRNEKDEATGQNVTRYHHALYAPVRFNETEVLSKEHHDRAAGFEIEVGTAWSNFLNANYSAEGAPGTGWRWTNYCISLNSPRNSEARNWAAAQEQTTYQRVYLPTYGIADTAQKRKPAAEQRAPVERQAQLERQDAVKQSEADAAAVRELNASLAREAQARNAAYEKARDDAAAAKARHEAEVAAIAARNAARAVEHARQVAAAEAAQRAYQEALQPKPKEATCTTRSFSTTLSETASTQAAASQALAARFAQARGGDSTATVTGGAPSCKQRNVLAIKPPPVGNCLSCISEKLAIDLYGYVPGQGYPAPKVEWQCTATAQIKRRECGTRDGSRVSNQ